MNFRELSDAFSEYYTRRAPYWVYWFTLAFYSSVQILVLSTAWVIPSFEITVVVCHVVNGVMGLFRVIWGVASYHTEDYRYGFSKGEARIRVSVHIGLSGAVIFLANIILLRFTSMHFGWFR
jgi:hypothetical protein